MGSVIGDALGRPFEGVSTGDGVRLRRAVEGRVAAPRAWGHSDDTEMMLAVGASVWRCGGVEEGDILASMAASHDPARGYGKGTRAALREWRETGDWRRASRALWEEGSRGNGAAVRVAPLAVWHRRDESAIVRSAARRSAGPTHCHDDAMTGAELVAVAVWLALAGVPAAAVVGELRGLQFGASYGARLQSLDPAMAGADAARTLGNGVLALESVPIALWALCRSSSFEEAVVEAVCVGGDTDSIGAMTGGVAGAVYGATAIPSSWTAALERPALRSVEELAERLAVAKS